MGVLLSEPVVDKTSESGEDNRLAYGISSMQGWRVTMEDAHAAVLDLQNPDDPTKAGSEGRISFFGVYDGHSGDMVANFSGENLHKIMAKQPADGLLSTDKAILQDPQYRDDVSGCTASTALITDTKIHVANAGDSRTVLSVTGRAKPLSFDHKPYNEGEKARICAAGGSVDSGRIVTAFPDVVIHAVSDDDEFLVIACDGIWDCKSSQAVIEFVRRGIAARQELHTICENMMDHCLAPSSDTYRGSSGNMTMIVVALLKNMMTKEEWYDLIAKRVADGDILGEFDIRITNNSVRSIGGAGHITMLDDGSEASTDSEDGEAFDVEEEERDLPLLPMQFSQIDRSSKT
ncbi:phosphatase 2C-like domain-containing protein [Tuber borchii]|uniref:protein-serine/threonine phosphatase n=1 Tax=Tuber borchii TaxID=42251 RepID=A0A2T7A4G1_TUBBO|nr:phosphatase 2C-like domain-containing protein [Tuber borchii]